MKNYNWEQFKDEWESFVATPTGGYLIFLMVIGIVAVAILFSLISII